MAAADTGTDRTSPPTHRHTHAHTEVMARWGEGAVSNHQRMVHTPPGEAARGPQPANEATISTPQQLIQQLSVGVFMGEGGGDLHHCCISSLLSASSLFFMVIEASCLAGIVERAEVPAFYGSAGK